MVRTAHSTAATAPPLAGPLVMDNTAPTSFLPLSPRLVVGVWRSLFAVTVVGVVLLALLGARPVGAQSGAVEVRPGEVLVTVQAEGTVVALAADGSTRVLLTGLQQPRAAAMLPDDTLVVAEAGANRLLGIGGRFGTTPTPIVDFPFPVGLAVRGNGILLVTSFDAGKLSAVDVGTQTVTDLATGLQAPSGVAVRDGTAYIAELNAQRVIAVDPNGEVATVAEGFEAPLGITLGPGSSLFVTDVATGDIIRLDGGEKTVVGNLPDPRDLTGDPASPPTADGGALLVAAPSGVQRVDTATGEVTVASDIPGAVSVGPGRRTAPPPPETTTSVAPDGDAGTAPGDAEGDLDLAPPGLGDDEPPGSPLFIIVLAGLILAAVVGFLTFQFRRGNAADAEAAAEDAENLARLESGTLHEAFGPCATEELEVERAQAALDSVIVQIEAMLRRVTDGEAVAEDARHALRRAEQARLVELASVTEAASRGEADDPDGHPIHQAEPLLVTDDGRQALEDYRHGLVTPLELAKRWDEAGEQKAIARVRREGARSLQADLTVPGSDEREARAVLDDALMDVEHAQHDLERLAEREKACRIDLQVAQEQLSTCRRSKPQPPATPDGHDPAQVAAWGGGGPGSAVAEPTSQAAPPTDAPPPPAPD